MKQYLIYAYGLDEEKWVNASSEKEAKRVFWNSLTDDEMDCVSYLECIDEDD